MTIELTVVQPLPYSKRRLMESVQEENSGKKEEKEEKKLRVHPDDVGKALKAWEKFNAQRKAQGKEVTQEQKKAQEQLAKKGKLPPEHNVLQTARFREIERTDDLAQEFEDLTEEIEEYRKAGLDVTRMIGTAKDWIKFFTGRVPGEKVEALNDKLEKLIKDNKQKEKEDDGLKNPIRKAWEKETQGMDLKDEEKALIEELIQESKAPIVVSGAGIMDDEDEEASFLLGEAAGGLQDENEVARREFSNQYAQSYGITSQEGKRIFGDIVNMTGTSMFGYPFVKDARRKMDELVGSGKMGSGERDVIEQLINQGIVIKQNQEMQRNEMMGRREGGRSAASFEQDFIDSVTAARTKSFNELKEDVRSGKIRKFLKAMEGYSDKSFDERGLDKILEIKEEAQFRKELEKVLDTEGNDVRAKGIVKEMGYSAPSSIQEIAYQIMAFEGKDYTTGGKYAMFKVKDKDEEGNDVDPHLEFQQQNFIRWARNKMIAWHESNPDDPGDMFKVVGVFGSLRPVSLGEMIYVDAFFRDKDTGEVLTDLRTQLIYEAWPFNSFRNFDIEYRNMKGSDEKLPESLQKIYMSNVATKKSVLNRVFSMADLDKEFPPKLKEGEVAEVPRTGQALRMALLSYYYLGNFEMLDKIFKSQDGKNLAFMDFNKFKGQYIKARIEEDGMLSEEAEKEFNKNSKYVKKHFKDDGTLKNSKDEKKEFIETSNLFNSAMINLEQIDEIRERIRLSIMERFGISYNDAKYAENFAHTMTRWTGIATLNDLNSVGFDAWSKVLNTEYYLGHQSSDRRGGAFGNRYTMHQFKRLGLDFFTGVTDVNKKSILEWIQGGQGENVNFNKHADQLLFGENTMTQFYANHIHRSFEMFHSIVGSKALKLNEIVFTDREGLVHTDPEKFDELYKEGFLKPMRYAYATWPGIDFTEEVPVFKEVRTVDKKTGEIKTKTVWVTEPLARRLFGKMMFNDQKYLINGKWEEFKYSEMLKDKDKFMLDYYEASKRKKTNYEYKENEEDLKIKDEEVLKREEEYLKKIKEGKYQNPEVIEKAFKDRAADGSVGGRAYFWREAAKVRLAAEIKEARKRGTLRKRMTFEETENFISILEQMDADMQGSEEGFETVRPGKKFFSPEEIKWIRKKAGVGFRGMMVSEIGWSILEGSPAGFFHALWALINNTFKTQ